MSSSNSSSEQESTVDSAERGKPIEMAGRGVATSGRMRSDWWNLRLTPVEQTDTSLPQ